MVIPVAQTITRKATNGKAFTTTAGVDMAGFGTGGLSTKRQYSSYATLACAVSKGYRLCGNDDYHTYAGKIMERSKISYTCPTNQPCPARTLPEGELDARADLD